MKTGLIDLEGKLEGFTPIGKPKLLFYRKDGPIRVCQYMAISRSAPNGAQAFCKSNQEFLGLSYQTAVQYYRKSLGENETPA